MSKKLHILFSLLLLSLSSLVIAENQPSKTSLSTEDKRKFDYYFYEAINAKSIEKYADSYDFLSYCARIDSTNANVLFELGNFYKSLRNNVKATDLYTKAVKYDPTNYFYSMSLASTLLEQQEYAKAIDIYQKLIKQNPTKVELYMYLSESYRLDGDFNKSIEALNNLERTMGVNESITLQKFKLYAALNDKKKAYTEIHKYIDKNPDDVRYDVLLANLYMQDNKMKEAYDVLLKAKAKDSSNSALISSLANYYELTNNTQAAEEILQSALFNNKVDADTKLEIMGMYITSLQQNKQDITKVNTMMDSLMNEYPQETKFNLLYGNLLMLEDKKQEANFQFRIFAESNPTNPAGWEQLLQTTDNDSIAALIDVCESAIKYLPEEPLFYFYLSIGQFQNKDYEKALQSVKKGTNYVDPDNERLLSEFYSQAGSIYYEQGKIDSCLANYDISLKYNPQNLGVLNNYSYYLSLLRKDLDKAEKMSSMTVKVEPTNPTFLDTYGWILFERGAYSTAKIYLQNALKYNEESKNPSSEIYEHYGDVLSKTGSPDEAVQYWIKAKEAGSKSKTLDEKIKTKTYIQAEVEE